MTIHEDMFSFKCTLGGWDWPTLSLGRNILVLSTIHNVLLCFHEPDTYLSELPTPCWPGSPTDMKNAHIFIVSPAAYCQLGNLTSSLLTRASTILNLNQQEYPIGRLQNFKNRLSVLNRWWYMTFFCLFSLSRGSFSHIYIASFEFCQLLRGRIYYV